MHASIPTACKDAWKYFNNDGDIEHPVAAIAILCYPKPYTLSLSDRGTVRRCDSRRGHMPGPQLLWFKLDVLI